MAFYAVTQAGGASTTIEAQDWMAALKAALPKLGVDIAGLGRFVCETSPDGSVIVSDPRASHRWRVTTVASAVAHDAAPFAPAPQPQHRAQEAEEDDDHIERLFELSGEIASASPDEACRAALRLVTQLVPCEAASIVRGTINDDALTFVAASGPVAAQIVGRKLPFGMGLSGLCFDLSIPVEVKEARGHEAHHAEFDRSTGFKTQGTLCVPVTDGALVAGVIQLLNPPHGFDARTVLTLESIGRTLAGALLRDLAA